MNECLFTKLKGTATDDSLPIYGELRIGSFAEQNIRLKIGTGSQILKIFSGNGVFVNVNSDANITISSNGKTLTHSGNSIFVFYTTTDCVISLFDKYNLIDTCSSNGSTSIWKGNMENFAYSNNMEYFGVEGVDIDEGEISGDIASLKDLTAIKSIHLQNCPDVYGNISSLIKLTSLTKVYLARTKVVGAVETFIEGLVANGATVNNIITISASYSGITLNGAAGVVKRVKITSTGADVMNNSNDTVVASYNKNTGTWTYA